MGKLLKVMVAEEGNEFGASCAAALRSNGFEVQLVPKDGTQVLRLARQNSPDVLVIDAFMPGLDAIGVLNGLDGTEKRPLVAVTTANSNPRLQQEIIESGADYYFIKPFDMQIFAERIKQMTGAGHAGQDNILKMNGADNSLEVTVSEIMHQIGVPAHIKGYQYLREAIILAVNDDEIMNSVTKLLYPTVAKQNKTTSSRVERRRPIKRPLPVLNEPFAMPLRSHGTGEMWTCSAPILAIRYRIPEASPQTASLLQ